MAQKAEWRNVFEGREISTGDNSEVRTALVETTDLNVTGVVTIRKWAKYTTTDDKERGLSKDDVPFRPTRDGLSFPASVIPEIIQDLQKIHDLALEKGVVNFVPAAYRQEAPVAEKKKPSRRPKVV